MGYSYDGRGKRCCDHCGKPGGVRKRTCIHKVLSDSLYSTDGHRHSLPYCSPPALCSPCYKALGGRHWIHAACEVGAAASQARADAIEAQLDAGEFLPTSAFGDWHAKVPSGKVGIIYRGRAGKRYALVSDADYKRRAPLSLVDHEPWEGLE
jgi:hypothetical protein